MIAKKLKMLLLKKGYKIAVAESCTGGLLASSIIAVAGTSEVIDIAFVTYSNDAKVKYLGVKKSTISSFGVVSEEVVSEMARGVAEKAGAKVGVAISGIAGPTGAVPGKPVGTVCFGFVVDEKVITVTMHFKGNRNTVQKKSAKYAMTKLIDLLS